MSISLPNEGHKISDISDYFDIPKSICVLVASSDGYRDVWPIFSHFFLKNSGLQELDTYITACKASFALEPIRTLNSPLPVDAPWGRRMLSCLEQVTHEYVILLTEDLLFLKPPCRWFGSAVRSAIQQDMTCLRLVTRPPVPPTSHERFSVIPNWAMHRVSLQGTIWNKSRLAALIDPSDTPWTFEVRGTYRSRDDGKFFCVHNNAIHYEEIVSRGKITVRGRNLLNSHGMLHLVERPFFSRREQLVATFARLKSKTFYLMPFMVQKYLISSGIIGRAFRP